MKSFAHLSLLLIAVAGCFSTLHAVAVGDKLDSVLAEKGNPTSRLERGHITLLTYADATIKLEDGAVVEIKAPAGNSKVNTMPVPKRQTAKAKSQIELLPPGQWANNFQFALNTAQATNKRMLLFFTGSDWCPWCQRLEREILATPEFSTYASENLVLVYLDFPKKQAQPDALKNQNEQLAKTYGVDRFPTVILTDTAGNPVGQRLGYVKGGTAAFIALLQRQ